MVLTAPMLMTVGDQPSFQKSLNNSPAKAQLPFLVVGHKKDACEHTAPPTIEAFTKWHGGKVDVVFLDGPQGTGDPCEAQGGPRLRRHRRNRRLHRHQLDQGAQIGGFAPPLALAAGNSATKQIEPVSSFRNRKERKLASIRELEASAAVYSNCKGRTANPIADAIPGQALILAGLLLLRRP